MLRHVAARLVNTAADQARIVARVLVGIERADVMWRRGLEQAKRLTWERCARETLDVLQGVGFRV